MSKTTESSTVGSSSCIIVGGGPGGIAVARGIAANAGANNVDVVVTVIDRQDYMDWSLASPRMLAQPDDIDKFGYVMPLDKVCEHVSAGTTATGTGIVKFVQGAVTEIGSNSVTLANGTTMNADVIVIAVGGQYSSGALWKPLPEHTTKELRIAAFQSLREEIAQCKSLVVAGAGPSGVEVAGELKAAFPDLTITLVGSLLPNSPPALQARMKAALEGMGITVKEGRVDVTEPDANGIVKLRDGTTIDGRVDMILNAAGFAFAGKKLADDTLQADVTERGQFVCRPTLQLQSIDTVFCCGDILAVPEGRYADVKGLNHADVTAEVVAKNVTLLLQQETPLHDFQWSKVPVDKPMMTALGPTMAVGYVGLPNFIENFMARFFKCKDYYMSLKGSSYGKGKTWN